MKTFNIRMTVEAPETMTEFDVENDLYSSLRYMSGTELINIDDVREAPEY